MCPVQSEINLILAKVTHRLDQLTKPTFDRATVEELIAEIYRLRSDEHRRQIAQELAWRDSKIDEQCEELDDKDDEIEGLRDALAKQLAVITDLQAVNGTLSSRLQMALMGVSQPHFVEQVNEKMRPMALTDDGLAVPLSVRLQRPNEGLHPSRLTLVPPRD